MSEQTFGPYRVLDKLGEGGMGVVYRARDTRLERDVALKVLPDVVSDDPDRLARFEREARLLASLNHPHIAQVFGFEREGDRRAIAMELVDGPTLAELIREPGAEGQSPGSRGLPLDRALAIARQIADALEAAHDQGVIHRDLKPANVKVRDDGTVKVLDFGLAKAMTGDEEASGPNAANSPTLTARATELGVILGTAAYMAPEQAKGKRVDKRADVWAFGVVLLEMLTGERAFEGEDISETLASVLAREPNFAALPATTPAPVRRLLERCLEKDPKKRARDIGDAMRRLDEDMAASVAGAPQASAEAHSGGGIGRWLLPAVALIIGAAGGAFLLGGAEPAEDSAGPVRFSYRPPNTDATISTFGEYPNVVIAPDGRQLLFRWVSDSGGMSFAVRQMDDPEAVLLRGSEGAQVVFFSPRGDAVGLVIDDRTVARIPLGGGRPQPLAELDEDVLGATWLEDGRIVVGTWGAGLFSLPENGGTAEALTTPSDTEHLWPSVIPGADALLFVENRQRVAALENGEVMVLDLASGETKALGLTGVSPSYAASGHVLYATASGSLWAAPFDVASLSVTGPAAPVIEQVRVDPYGAADYSVSRDGRLVYLSNTGGFRRQLVWVDDTGAMTPLPTPLRQYSYVWLSPDDSKLSLDVRDEGRDIWVYDIARNTLERRTTTDTDDEYGLWSRDGRDLVFSDQTDLYRVPANGTAAPEPITRFDADSTPPFPNAVTGDRRVVFRQVTAGAGNDLYIVPLDGGAEPELLLGTPDFDERNPALSPDDQWLAYESNQSGSERYEVFARPFPDLNADLVQVSNAGGRYAVWSRDGSALFYLDAADQMTRVPFSRANGFGQPVTLFDASRFFTGNMGRNYDVARDGRFIMVAPERGSDGTALSVVINWFDVLREIR